MKMNIQLFAATNSTANYNLSQYVGSDKPTYLGDYNSDMLKIDTAIAGNATDIGLNSNAIGDLTALETTAKSDLVTAVNEVNSGVGTNAGAISTTNTNIGSLANLDTTNKTSIVNAINEIVGKFNFSYNANLTVTGTTISGTAPTITSDINSAYNSDGSIGKIYGQFKLTGNGSGVSWSNITIGDTGLRPASDITIMGIALQNVARPRTGNSFTSDTERQYTVASASFTLKTDGTIEMLNLPCWDNEERTFIFVAGLIFATDFGDTPIVPQ